MGDQPRSYIELRRNHGDLKKFLVAEAGAENVLELSDLLYDIFDNADYEQRYAILKDMMEDVADTYIDNLQSRGIPLEKREPVKIVRDLIHGYPRKLILNNGKLPNLIIPPKREMMWMRDSSAVTPCGIVINSMAHNRRKFEPQLVRTVFRHHPMFDEGSIFLDMVEFKRKMRDDITTCGLHDRYLIEGGNILVLSENAIAVGVGREHFLYSNRTTRLGFELLVKAMFEADTGKKLQRIYLVNVPDLRGFIHIDTVFNMFAPKSAIAMPYIFGHPDPAMENMTATDVLKNFVKWLRRNMGVLQTDLSRIPSASHFEYAGRVEVYDRDYIKKKGEVIRTPIKAKYFFDQLVEDNLLDLNNVIWLGGKPEQFVNAYDHLKVALFEQHNMAGNIFTTAPYRSIAYHRNVMTVNTLRKKMLSLNPESHLEEMSSNEVRTDNGGPHCLTLPLLRED
jgi:arginine deiminase